uniref:Translation initiation factor 5A C-terminal domain-containing protein n=1 Tax=Buteo japonicus TaxID=224669 RepID=A0A8B9Z166_9AVES
MLNFLKANFSSQLIGIQDGYLSLLTESGEVREDLKLPEGDLGKEIEGKFNANEDVQVSIEGRQEELWLIPLDYTMKESYSNTDHL